MQTLLRHPRVLVPLFLAPGVGYLLIFFGGPLLSALVGSLRLEDGTFTLAWYERIFTRPSMLRGLKTSIWRRPGHRLAPCLRAARAPHSKELPRTQALQRSLQAANGDPRHHCRPDGHRHV
jgi:hypothetical protein